MSGEPAYEPCVLSRAEVDRTAGLMVLEFGNEWCGHCRAAAIHVGPVLSEHPDIRHVRIADSRACRLGRTFGVKLWPTLVFLRDGSEIARVVRPTAGEPVREAVTTLTAQPTEHTNAS